MYHYHTKNITVGNAELVYSENFKAWVCPGNKLIHNKEEAKEFASKLNILISSNLKRSNQKLF